MITNILQQLNAPITKAKRFDDLLIFISVLALSVSSVNLYNGKLVVSDRFIFCVVSFALTAFDLLRCYVSFPHQHTSTIHICKYFLTSVFDALDAFKDIIRW
jgi:hypothetical protein